MTLAYIVSRFPVITETFILREILSLQALGMPVQVFALRQMHPSLTQAAASQIAADVHFPSFERGLHSLWRNPRAAQRLFRMTLAGHRSSPRVLGKALVALVAGAGWADQMRVLGVRHVHAHFGSYPALAALATAQFQQIGFSLTVHAHDLFADNDMLGTKARRARLVIAISDFNRQRLASLVPAEDMRRVRVIHCGVDPSVFRFTPRSIGAHHSLVSVAALREYKGLQHLIDACRLLRRTAPETSFECHIVGDGPQHQTLARHIAACGLEGVVFLEGAADELAVRRFLTDADVFVLPSVVARNGYMDGIPVALMEAMACGVPVVASGLSGIPELVCDGDTGLLVPPGDPEAICAAILRTWSEPDAAMLRAERARRLIEREYNLGETTRQLAGAFHELMSS